MGGTDARVYKHYRFVNERAAGTISLQTPAKLNLGLEIRGRRADGFHEIATILQAITIFDRVTLTDAAGISVTCDEPGLATSDNLAVRAVERLRARIYEPRGARIQLEKAIPVAAGLGGASSDAAAALLAARALWRTQTSDALLLEIGAAIGSDVPFFLRGGTALATGRGEKLAPLPAPSGHWFVIVAPHLVIRRKTATLYRALGPADFSDGAAVQAQAGRLRRQQPIDRSLLVNPFTRPLTEIAPELVAIASLMHELGAPDVALSGAGPSHYTVLTDSEQAMTLANRLKDALSGKASVILAEPVVKPASLVAT